MITKFRYEFKKDPTLMGWVKMQSGNEYSLDVFSKPSEWGLFVWNPENKYPAESAISLHKKEVSHPLYVCRPTKYK